MRKGENIVNAIKRADAVPVTVFLWSIALVLTLVLSLQAKRTFFALREYASMKKEESASLIEIRKIPLNGKDYQGIKERLAAAHPGVLFEAQADGIKVAVSNVMDYERFRSVLYSVMESVGDTRWEVVSLCAGEACNSPAYRAELKGYAIRITSKSGR